MAARKHPSTRYYAGPYQAIYVTLDGKPMHLEVGDEVAVTKETAEALDAQGDSWSTTAVEQRPVAEPIETETDPAAAATDPEESTQ